MIFLTMRQARILAKEIGVPVETLHDNPNYYVCDKLPLPVRKATSENVKRTKVHTDATRYTRTTKHKGRLRHE